MQSRDFTAIHEIVQIVRSPVLDYDKTIILATLLPEAYPAVQAPFAMLGFWNSAERYFKTTADWEAVAKALDKLQGQECGDEGEYGPHRIGDRWRARG